MKRIKVMTSSFENTRKKSTINVPASYKDYIIDQIVYDYNNTKSRENSLLPFTKQKIPKVMEWYENSGYEYYLWIDPKIILEDGFLESIVDYADTNITDLLLFSHPERSSVKEEIDFIFDENRNPEYRSYDGEMLKEQLEKYFSDNGFIDHQLFYTGLFMYSGRLVQNRDFNMMGDWFMHCILYHINDQLWLPYLLSKHNVNYKVYG